MLAEVYNEEERCFSLLVPGKYLLAYLEHGNILCYIAFVQDYIIKNCFSSNSQEVTGEYNDCMYLNDN